MEMHPQTWDDVLNGPAYVINMDRQPHRLHTSFERLKEAGFTNVIRWQAFDATRGDPTEEWAQHGPPLFNCKDGTFVNVKEHPHKQGTLLSHLSLWKHIIDTKIPWAVIFEDDIVFHKHWAELAPQYFAMTPPDYGMCYMGHHCGCGVNAVVLQVPVYCLHAFIITLEGATCLYNKMIHDPNGVCTIDLLIYEYMMMSLVHPNDPQHEFCKWYAWNAEMFPDDIAKKHPAHAHKDMGLIFQECV